MKLPEKIPKSEALRGPKDRDVEEALNTLKSSERPPNLASDLRY